MVYAMWLVVVALLYPAVPVVRRGEAAASLVVG